MDESVDNCSSSEDGAGSCWVSSAGRQGADGLGTDAIVTSRLEAGGLVTDRVQMDGIEADDTNRQDTKLRVLTERVAALSAELTVQGAELSAATTSVTRVREALQCSVCLEPFAQAHTLQCGHTFCLACLQQWLPGHRQCPTCRALVTQRPIAAYAVQDAVRCLGIHTNEAETETEADTDTGTGTDDAWARMFRAPGRRSWSPSASPPLSLFEAGELDEPFAHGTTRSTENWMRTLAAMSETESELESSLIRDRLRMNASRPYTLMREVREQQHNERMRQVNASTQEPLQLIADMRSRISQMRTSNEQQPTSHSSAYASRLDPASTSGGSVRVAPYLQTTNTSRRQDPAEQRVEGPLIQDTELLLDRARSQLREHRSERVERERALLEQRRAESEQWRRDYEQRRQAREQREREREQMRAELEQRRVLNEQRLEDMIQYTTQRRAELDERLQESVQRRITLREQAGVVMLRGVSEARPRTDVELAGSLRRQIVELRSQVRRRATALSTETESPSHLLQQIGNIRMQVQQLRNMSGAGATMAVHFQESVDVIAAEFHEQQHDLDIHVLELDSEDRSVLDRLEYTVASAAPSRHGHYNAGNEHMWESMSDVSPFSDVDDPVSAINRHVTGMREQLQVQLSTSSVDVYQTEDQESDDSELGDQEMDDHEWQQRRVARRREILENMLSGPDASGVELSAWIRRRLDIPELNPSSPEYDPVTQTRVLTEYFQRTQPSSQSTDRIRLQRRRQP
ncbi:E3 ubiquitin ligase [Coemansia sp. RSA 1972]|nr:E3 ubiquitin ligase [Coemansia sp. RSA 1972]